MFPPPHPHHHVCVVILRTVEEWVRQQASSQVCPPSPPKKLRSVPRSTVPMRGSQNVRWCGGLYAPTPPSVSPPLTNRDDSSVVDVLQAIKPLSGPLHSRLLLPRLPRVVP